MSLGAVLVILVAAGDAQTVSAETYVALVAAAQRALPKDTVVRLLAVPDPAREELAKVEERFGARAVATLTWRSQPGGLRASLRLRVAGDLGWTERTMVFSARDAPSERGRTLGFAIASMWPGSPLPPANDNGRTPTGPVPGGREAPSRTSTAGDNANSADNGRPNAVVKDPGSRPAPAPAPAPVPATARTAPSIQTAARALSSAPTSSSPSVSARAFAARPSEIGLGVVGATGLGGPAGGFGGTVELAWAMRETVHVRALLALRVGEIAALGAFDGVAVAGAGLEWWPRPLASVWGGALGLYGDLVWTCHWIQRRAATDPAADPADPSRLVPAESRGRMLPAADLGLRASLRLGSSWRLLLGLGGELAFGRTELRTGDQHVVVATIPPARAVASLVLRYAF